MYTNKAPKKRISLKSILIGLFMISIVVVSIAMAADGTFSSGKALDSRLIGTWESNGGWPKSITFNRDNTVGLDYTLGSLGREFENMPIKRIDGNEIILTEFHGRSTSDGFYVSAWQSLVYQFAKDSEGRTCLLIQVKDSPNDNEPSQAVYYRVE